jgi:hypothetical protein
MSSPTAKLDDLLGPDCLVALTAFGVQKTAAVPEGPAGALHGPKMGSVPMAENMSAYLATSSMDFLD